MNRQTETAQVPRRGFEELILGEVFELPSTTLDATHFATFQALTGDDHPMHYDLAECQSRGHENLLAHGLQVAALGAAGAGLFPYVVEECMLGFLEQSTQFRRPALLGDTLTPSLTVSELVRQNTTGVVVLALVITNQRGEVVAEGTHKYLLRLTP